MNNSKKILSIVIPAYNEEKFIGKLLSIITQLSLSDSGFEKEIIVVNDGSIDGTSNEVKKYPNVKLFEQSNKGKGAAVQYGIQTSTGHYILVQDADLEYDPVDILKMLSRIRSNEEVAVYGSRILGAINNNSSIIFRGKTKDQSFLPWFVNRSLSILILILYKKWISDPLTGYKMYPRSFLLSNPADTKGFETDHELTAKLIKNKIDILEVPVSYKPRTREEGKKIGPMDGFLAIVTLFKYRF